MKTKTNKPKIETNVSIVRPAAEVTITIKGLEHKITEEEARSLFAKLKSALGIIDPAPFVSPYREPIRWRPAYLQPLPMPPGWDENKVMCSLVEATHAIVTAGGK